MARTDTHILVVANHTTGQRYSQAGTEEELEQLAADQKKVWKGDKLEVIIQKR
jgi:hypothetical protein